jgi:hypothetical protein
MTRRNLKTKHFTIPLSEADMTRLNEAADFLGVYKAEMARDVLLKWLATDYPKLKEEGIAA